MLGLRRGEARVELLSVPDLLLLAVLGFALGPMAIVLSAITLPVPLLLLWLATDVYRSDESEPAPAVVRVRQPAQENAAVPLR